VRGNPCAAAGRRNDRGQFVLLAGVVVALALAAMLVAYLQLGYHADATASSTDRVIADSTAYLDRTTHEATRPLRGEYDWEERNAAVTVTRYRTGAGLGALERTRAADGVAVRATFNATAASQWAGTRCSSGPGRPFGTCVADRGVVVQERVGRTLVVAVAYDLTVTTADGTTRLTTVVNATR